MLSLEENLLNQTYSALRAGQWKHAIQLCQTMRKSHLRTWLVRDTIASTLHNNGYHQAATALLQEAEEERRQWRLSLDPQWQQPLFVDQQWTSMIGHMGFCDWIAKARVLGLMPPAQIRLKPQQMANTALAWYLQKEFPLWEENLPDPPEYEAYRLSLHGFILNNDHFYPINALSTHIQSLWDQERRPSLFTPDAGLTEVVTRGLASEGVHLSERFVCLHVRESGFHSALAKQYSLRDDCIDAYLPALRWLVSQGVDVVRIGNNGMKPLPSEPGFVDYAHAPWRRPEYDIHFLSTCWFFMGSSSGPSAVPPMFGRPCLLTGWPTVKILQHSSRDKLLLKHYRWTQSGHPLKLSERIREPLGVGQSAEMLERSGVSVENNTAEEIMEATREMAEELLHDPSQEVALGQDAWREYARGLGAIGLSRLARVQLETVPELSQ
jgi:putative glycosyltransferase (TIGR04372 family)